MAYAAVVSLAQTINQILNHDHTPTTHPLHQQIIRSIRENAVVLQSFLEKSPGKANSLESQIRDIANTAENLIDLLLCEINPSDFRLRFSKLELQLKEVAEKLNSTAADAVAEKLNSTVVSSSLRRASKSKDVVLGSPEDLFWISKQLIFGSFSTKLQVLPIVGTGGIGKTTLAKLLYNSAPIAKSFDIQGWVTVSQDYSVGSIALDLLASVKGILDVESKMSREDEISQCLRGKRYLIVMDDVWSKRVWDDVRGLFPDDDNGSRIILTTRLQDVAAYASHSGPSHTVHFLSADNSWSLLRQKVFGDQPCTPQLEQVGREIAAQCRGLPLSVVVVAGILSKIDRTYPVWKQIAESDGRPETIISLSYNHLPHHRKACFLYMGGFPEDYEVCVSELNKLWVAEGFIQCPHASKTLEEEADDCLEDLVERSLVLVTSTNFDGKTKRCKLHDVVRDFCIREGGRAMLLLSVVDYLPSPILRRHFLPRVMKNHRRISATWSDLDLKDSMHSSRTRSIICIPHKGYRRPGCVKNFSLLRILHVLRRNEYWDWEPSQVFDLIYLTYLASNIPTNIVPQAISKLKNLQTLIIYRFEVRLPVEIWRLRHLRHLIAFSFLPLAHPEEVALPLENLQTLSLATDFICSERMMEMIPNIRKLGIRYSEEKFGEGFHLGNLTCLLQIEKLKLESHRSFLPRLNHVFPLSLKKLTLSGCCLPWSDMQIVGSLPSLQVLKLRKYAFDGEQWETAWGGYCELRLLIIDESNLRYWRARASHFPRLKSLKLLRCPCLSEIPIAFRTLRTLELIEIDGHNQSLFESAKKIQARWDGNVQVSVKHF